MKKVKIGFILTLCIAILMLIASSCSNDGNELKKKTTLEGNWSFESSNTSGVFTINSDLEVISGSFTVLSNTHAVVIAHKITDMKIFLDADGNSLVFIGYTINNDYTQLTSLKMEYASPTRLLKETVTMKRE